MSQEINKLKINLTNFDFEGKKKKLLNIKNIDDIQKNWVKNWIKKFNKFFDENKEKSNKWIILFY